MDILQYIDDLNAHLEQYYWFKTYKFFMGLYLIIMTLAIVFSLWRIGRSYWIVLSTGQGSPKVTEGQFQRQWKMIQKKMTSDNQNEWKSAVIEASYVLDSILSIIGYPGDNLTAKLDGMKPDQLSNLEEVKALSGEIEKMLQDPQYDPSKETAEQMLAVYETSIRFFKAIV